MGLADMSRHIIGCHVTQSTRVQHACDDVASSIRQALVIGTRCISYIVYLTDPDDGWTEEDGGALELYPVESPGMTSVKMGYMFLL